MSPDIEGLRIFTLNCWGLRYFSQHRKLRIKLIAQHLSEHDYDIVFLQEVWIQSDFDYIRSKSKSRYPFAHMFNNASILGTSGLVIMCKWVPNMIHFHPYSINGSPFRPHHGDWFSTKGVAYVRIELKGFNLHLFCTHMHAQYDEDEDITDQYSIHRVCQSYELAKYINLMACNCSNASSKDLIILAGDMNTSSKELPYRLLVELTGLSDCYKYDRKKKVVRKKENTLNGHLKKVHLNRLKLHTCSDESSDEEMITCGHKDNTFTDPKLMSSSKRIDFILFKLRDKFTDVDECGSCSENLSCFTVCRPEHIKINAKDVSGLSYSDHQPVAAKLKFHLKSVSENGPKRDSDTNIPTATFVSEVNEEEEEEEEEEMRFGLYSSIAKPKKGSAGKLKQWARGGALSHHQAHFTSLPPPNNKTNSPLLHDIEHLLSDYTNGSTLGKHLLTVGVVLFAAAVLMAVTYFTIDLTLIEVVLLSIILLIVCMFCLFLRFVTHRHEINAVKAILNDIRKKKSFGTDYGLLQSE